MFDAAFTNIEGKNLLFFTITTYFTFILTWHAYVFNMIAIDNRANRLHFTFYFDMKLTALINVKKRNFPPNLLRFALSAFDGT